MEVGDCMAINSYNKFINYGVLSYNIITYLMNNNEDIWKMLKHNTPDALGYSDLSILEKGDLIYSGETNSEPFNVFRDPFTDDAFEKQVCQLRIFPSSTNPENHITAIQDIQIQIVCHVKINYMDDYAMRMDRMIEEILKTLNGADIGGLGVMYFNKDRSRTNSIMRGSNVGNNKNFLGALITMSVNIA
jgi:hypothetical protein